MNPLQHASGECHTRDCLHRLPDVLPEFFTWCENVQVALTADVAVTAKEALPADVELRALATTSEEAVATWFWELLIQAGYEPV